MKTEKISVTSVFAAIFAAVFALTGCRNQSTEPVRIYIDERLELMNIIFRAADVPWYQNGVIEPYNDAIDSYFAPFRQHAAVVYARQIAESHRMGGDAVATFAVLLEIKDGKIAFSDGAKLDFGRRWQGDMPYEFLNLLNAFYTDTDFHKFFESQQSIYKTAVERYREGFEGVDLNWFDRYFGTSGNLGKFNIVLNLAESEWNYGPSTTTDDGNENIYAIVATSYVDSLKRPTYDWWSYEVVIHEFMHSYANPLIDMYSADLQAANQTFYDFSAETLRNYGVGSARLFLYETLVRAACIEYHREHSDGADVDELLDREHHGGFLWMGKLCELLREEYAVKRDVYPDLQSFMPKIVALLNSLSPQELTKHE